MTINSNDSLFDLPIMQFRSFFKKFFNNWDVEDLMLFFNLGKEKADDILIKLEAEGYVEKERKLQDIQLWKNTIKGNALGIASAAKPILRKTAEKKLAEFLERVQEVNRNEYYLYKVKEVILFGSYLRDTEKLGDIDLAVEIVPKETDNHKFYELTSARSKEAIKKGRIFNSFIEEAYFPYTEVYRYLKSRSRSISLHETNDAVLKTAEHKVLFREE
ncbi:MAG: nucleotidyltransferase domain-containing protein [Oscillospiraceae bacterium]